MTWNEDKGEIWPCTPSAFSFWVTKSSTSGWIAVRWMFLKDVNFVFHGQMDKVDIFSTSAHTIQLEARSFIKSVNPSKFIRHPGGLPYNHITLPVSPGVSCLYLYFDPFNNGKNVKKNRWITFSIILRLLFPGWGNPPTCVFSCWPKRTTSWAPWWRSLCSVTDCPPSSSSLTSRQWTAGSGWCCKSWRAA